MLQPATQFCNRRGLDKDAHRLVAIVLLDIHATFHIDIEHHVLSCLQLAVYLRLQRPIETIGIHLFILQELIVFDTFPKLLRADEEILHAILLFTSGCPRCAGNGESEFQFRVLLHQPGDNRRFSCTTGSGEYNQFTSHIL